MTGLVPPEPEAPPEEIQTPDPQLKREIVSTPPDLEYPIAPEEAYTSAPDDIYAGISTLPVTGEQEKILQTPVKLDQIEINPMGEVYAPHAEYRKVLCAAFHPGGWAIRPLGKPTLWGNWLMQWYALYVGGRYISSAPAEAQYFPDNPRMVYATALESLRSVALRRLCKDLGVFLELWNRDFVQAFIAENCVQVEYLDNKNKVSRGWRRKNAAPIGGELDLAEMRARTKKTQEEKAKPQPKFKSTEESDAEMKKTAESVGGVMVSSETVEDLKKPEPITGNYQVGVLTYRTDKNTSQVLIGGSAWRNAHATVGKDAGVIREKVLPMFEHEKHLDAYLQKHFNKTTVAALTYEELAAIYADKREGKRDQRWFTEEAENIVLVNWIAFQSLHPDIPEESITNLKSLVAAGTLEFGSEAFLLAVREVTPL